MDTVIFLFFWRVWREKLKKLGREENFDDAAAAAAVWIQGASFVTPFIVREKEIEKVCYAIIFQFLLLVDKFSQLILFPVPIRSDYNLRENIYKKRTHHIRWDENEKKRKKREREKEEKKADCKVYFCFNRKNNFLVIKTWNKTFPSQRNKRFSKMVEIKKRKERERGKGKRTRRRCNSGSKKFLYELT